MVDPNTVITAASGVVTLLSKLKDLTKKAKKGDPNLQEHLDQMQLAASQALEAITELRKGELDLVERMRQLQDENGELKQRVKQKEMVFKANVYWIEDKFGHLDGPFCPVHRDQDEKVVRLGMQNGPEQVEYSCECMFVERINKSFLKEHRVPDYYGKPFSD